MEPRPSREAIVVAWIAVLAASLPEIVLREVVHLVPSEGLRVAIPGGVALAGFTLTFLRGPLRVLRAFFGVLIVLVAVQWVVYTRIAPSPFFRGWVDEASIGGRLMGEQALRLMVTVVIVAVLWAVKRRPSAFFLARGDTSAAVAPVRLLRTKPTLRWNVFGRNLALFISLGTLTFMLVAARPPVDVLPGLPPLVPVILLVAALNAFNEEVTFKASFLSVLEDAVGARHSLLLMAAFFGLAHYYGMPHGVVGVLMAGVLGWLLGKSMLETRGLFWAWFIHFCQDVLIFGFLAAGALVPGDG